jgi:2-dehydro-3-deoxyphosphogluconate aldolase/(4S)-4-hydroxy-2-oxoglutarate aldolase
VGGLTLLQALHGPFGQTRFCPTGGVNVNNARDFLGLPNVLCVGGSWLTPSPLVEAGDWASIEKLAHEASRLGQVAAS